MKQSRADAFRNLPLLVAAVLAFVAVRCPAASGQVSVAVGPERRIVSRFPQGGVIANTTTPSGGGLFFGASNVWWQPADSGVAQLVSTVSAPNQQDDPISSDRFFAWSWRVQPNGGMNVYARLRDFSAPPFDAFPWALVTEWQPDAPPDDPFGVVPDQWLTGVEGWDENSIGGPFDGTGPTGPALQFSQGGGSANWPTVAISGRSGACVFRWHAGTTGPDLMLRLFDPVTLVQSPAPKHLLPPGARPGDHNWPMVRALSRPGFVCAFQHKPPGKPWQIEAVWLTRSGRRYARTVLGDGMRPWVFALTRGWCAVTWRNSDLIMLAIMDAQGVPRWLGPVNVDPCGPLPGSITDRPSFNGQTIEWTDTTTPTGTRDICRVDVRLFGIGVP